MKTHSRWYQYVQSLQFSHNDMSIVRLKCVILEGCIVSLLWICWFNVWCHPKKQKHATFCISWKENILDESLPKKKKPTKYSSQQIWFVDVSKSSQMHHWSKDNLVAKLEKINIIRGIKLIKLICVSRSQVEKKIITW
jgi:hypothetical protein